METAEKQFVSFEIAKQLKQVGCTKPSMAYFTISDEKFHLGEKWGYDISNFIITAPLWQQVLDWLLEKGFYIPYKTDKTFLEKDILNILNHIFEMKTINL